MRCCRFLAAIFVAAALAAASPSPPGDSIPSDWLADYSRADLLYGDPATFTNSTLMPSLGNGYMASFVGSDALFVAGLYNGEATSAPSHRARIPSFANIQLLDAKIANAGMHLRNGTYVQRSVIGTDPGCIVEEKWYFHRQDMNVFMYTADLLLGEHCQQAKACFQMKLGAPSSDLSVTKLPAPMPGTALQRMETRVPEASFSTVESVFVLFDDLATGPRCAVLSASSPTFVARGVVSAVGDTSSAGVISLFKKAAAEPVASSVARHLRAWSAIWMSGIEVENNLPLAQAINASSFYILNSLRPDLRMSISPGSLASNSYNGHVFWDFETWVYPFLNFLHPDFASAALGYRIDRLATARLKAQSYVGKGYRGAMFPWESAWTGIETCPSWAPTGQLEQHISADIAVAAMQYVRMHGDEGFFLDVACPLATGTAEFWASRVELDQADGKYHIAGVIPPDEYAVNVTDSVYTNVATAMNLLFADRCTPNVTWVDIAHRLAVAYDPVQDYHPEYAGYNGVLVKQADTILLGYPLNYAFETSSTRKNDLDYYANRTDSSGPAMTWAMFSVGYLQLGDSDLAASYFVRGYANAQKPFSVWTETPTGGATNFVTGAGGFLQSVVAGYGGLKLSDAAVELMPVPPPGTSALVLRQLAVLGHVVDVTASAAVGTVSVVLVDASADSVAMSTAEATRGNGSGDLCLQVAPGGSLVKLQIGVPFLVGKIGTAFLLQLCSS